MKQWFRGFLVSTFVVLLTACGGGGGGTTASGLKKQGKPQATIQAMTVISKKGSITTTAETMPKRW